MAVSNADPRATARCAVTGSTGYIGRHLCAELTAAGHEVLALHRATSDVSVLNGLGVTRREGDVTDPDSLLRAFEDADWVFHLAGLFRKAKSSEKDYWAVHVDGTRNVLDAAVASGARKVVHVSTIGVHGHIPDPPADETEAYRPADIYQVTKCEGEKLALEYFRSGKLLGCVIRPAMVWGPGDIRFRKLFRGIQRRRLPIIGTGEILLHWVDVRDLTRGLRLAAEKEDNSGEVYIIAGATAVRLERVFELIADRLDTSLLPFRIPAAPLALLGDVVEAICKPLGVEPPIYRRRVGFFTKTRSFDWSKAGTELGYEPAGSLEDEIRDVIRSYRELGWLD